MRSTSRITVHILVLGSLALHALCYNPSSNWRNGHAMVSLHKDNTVRAWGASNYGGQIPDGIKSAEGVLREVEQVVSTLNGFIALHTDKSITVWGSGPGPLEVPPSDDLKGEEIFVNDCAAAVVQSDGSVAVFGQKLCGGNPVSGTYDINSHIYAGRPRQYAGLPAILANPGNYPKTITTSKKAMAALLDSGDVAVWGHYDYGGCQSGSLTGDKGTLYAMCVNGHGGFVQIFSSDWSMVGLTSEGKLRAWGHTVNGGNNGVNNVETSNVVNVFSCTSAFAALKKDSSVLIWGDAGTCGSTPVGGVTGVETIASTSSAMAALKQDGSIQLWGNARRGGKSDSPLKKAVRIFSNEWSFCSVLKDDGKTQCWGLYGYGGCDYNGFTENRKGGYCSEPIDNIQWIFSNAGAYASLRKDGTADVNGDEWHGGWADCSLPRLSGANTPITGVKCMKHGTLKNIVTVSGNDLAMAALLSDGSVKVWGNLDSGGSINSQYYTTLSDVVMVYGKTTWYSDSTAGNLYPCPSGRYGTGYPACHKCPGKTDDSKASIIQAQGVRSTIDSCIDCPAGKYSSDGLTCAEECTAGQTKSFRSYFHSLDSCLDCHKGFFSSHAGTAECSACPHGKYTSQDNSLGCLDCDAGKYAPAGSSLCYPCPSNSHGNETTSNAGTAYTETDCFISCEAGRYGVAFNGICEDCFPGTYNFKERQSSCLKCPKGYYKESYGLGSCDACIPGTYSALEGSPQCSLCPAGTYSTDSAATRLQQCNLCQAGRFSYPGSTVCLEAPPGSFTDRDGATNATSCAAGRYQPSRGKLECIDTSPGRYTLEGAAVELKCPPGTYSSIEKATSAAACLDCPKGFSSKEGSVSCTSCKPGYYNNETQQSDCKPCPPGSASQSPGTTYCRPCKEGNFAHSSGSTTCLPCGINTFSASDGQSSCNQCSFGKTTIGLKNNGTGAKECVVSQSPCDGGQYRSKEGLCLDCEAGSMSPLGLNCTHCAPGTFSAERRTSLCTSCPPGSINTQSGQTTCLACEKGKFSSTNGGTSCLRCPPGSFCNTSALAFYADCPAGTYTDVGEQMTCFKCPQGRYQQQRGSAKCLTCPKGKYNDQLGSIGPAECRVCGKGRYSSQEGSPTCVRCEEGFFQEAENSTSCYSCRERYGATMTSNAGRTGCEVDQALAQESLAIILFDRSFALYGAASISSGFLFIVCISHFASKSINTHHQGQLGVQSLPSMLLKALLPGFSFGSELFLIMALFEDQFALAVSMVVFRSLHMIFSTLLLLCTFGSSKVARQLEKAKGYFRNISTLRDKIDFPSARKLMPIMIPLTLTTMCDVTMLRFLPWRASRFNEESKGFPTLQVMKICLCVDAIQATASAVCQIIFLSTRNLKNDAATASWQALALFSLSIATSLFSVIIILLQLCLQGGLLKSVEKEELLARAAEKDKTGESKMPLPYPQLEDRKRGGQPPALAPHSDDHISLIHTYPDAGSDIATITRNPMFLAATSQADATEADATEADATEAEGEAEAEADVISRIVMPPSIQGGRLSVRMPSIHDSSEEGQPRRAPSFQLSIL